ncbi:MAG: hypothetical protein DHS80DRAFT_33090 [Piptocephalis tieghemiana]|nr:MAG: hypothetical protein DHS80DRAFT_33090 [Piptocephalis tieghemiana]
MQGLSPGPDDRLYHRVLELQAPLDILLKMLREDLDRHPPAMTSTALYAYSHVMDKAGPLLPELSFLSTCRRASSPQFLVQRYDQLVRLQWVCDALYDVGNRVASSWTLRKLDAVGITLDRGQRNLLSVDMIMGRRRVLQEALGTISSFLLQHSVDRLDLPTGLQNTEKLANEEESGSNQEEYSRQEFISRDESASSQELTSKDDSTSSQEEEEVQGPQDMDHQGECEPEWLKAQTPITPSTSITNMIMSSAIYEVQGEYEGEEEDNDEEEEEDNDEEEGQITVASSYTTSPSVPLDSPPEVNTSVSLISSTHPYPAEDTHDRYSWPLHQDTPGSPEIHRSPRQLPTSSLPSSPTTTQGRDTSSIPEFALRPPPIPTKELPKPFTPSFTHSESAELLGRPLQDLKRKYSPEELRKPADLFDHPGDWENVVDYLGQAEMVDTLLERLFTQQYSVGEMSILIEERNLLISSLKSLTTSAQSLLRILPDPQCDDHAIALASKSLSNTSRTLSFHDRFHYLFQDTYLLARLSQSFIQGNSIPSEEEGEIEAAIDRAKKLNSVQLSSERNRLRSLHAQIRVWADHGCLWDREGKKILQRLLTLAVSVRFRARKEVSSRRYITNSKRRVVS